MKKQKILSFGSLNYDIFFEVPHIVLPGETISSSGIEESVGGKGLNQSISLSRSGLDVFHAGAVGELDGDVLITQLEKNNVNVKYVEKKTTKSGSAFIQIDENGQNSIILHDGANKMIEKEFIDRVLNEFDKNDVIILQNEISNMDYIISKASEKQMIIFLNPSPLNKSILQADLKLVDWFILNEIEAHQLIGKTGTPDEILDLLSQSYPKSNFVITLGEKGSVARALGENYQQSIFNTNAIDTTGAGDTFTGYFISHVLKDPNNLKKALRIASAASAIAVTRKGASPSIPHLKEVLDYLDFTN